MAQLLAKFKKDVVGILWAGTSGLLFLMLYSFRATDPSFNSAARVTNTQNFVGYFGSFTSDVLFQVFGVAAWASVMVTLYMSWSAFVGKKAMSGVARFVCGLGLVLTTCSLLALYFPETRVYEGAIPLGGILGIVVSKALVMLFNKIGVAVILWTLSLMFLVIFTERSLRDHAQVPLAALFRAKGIFGLIGKYFAADIGKRESAPTVLNVETAAPTPRLLERLNFLESKKSDNEHDDLDNESGVAIDAPLRVKMLKRDAPKQMPKMRRTVENWQLPKISLLREPAASKTSVDNKSIKKNVDILEDKLAQFSVKGKVVAVKPGPAVTMYEFKPNADVKISEITALENDLALALSSESLRIIAPLPGRDVVGIEASNLNRDTVFMREMLEDAPFWEESIKLPVALGKQASGETRIEDLRKMPHLLVAGSTGSGKSVFVTSLVTGLVFRHSPKTLRLIVVDPKQVDLAAFHNIPHLLMPPVFEAKKAVMALKWAINEMNKRYKSMSKFHARGLESFNDIVEKLPKVEIEEHSKINDELFASARNEMYYYQQLPYIVIVVEEFGDLMVVDKANVEMAVQRLTQMARACGIHLVLAMQSPRKDVVTGLIKTNIPGRISFKVASKTDSRIILDEAGAERLLARGDMLFLAPGVSKPQRHHAAYLSDEEIAAVAKFWSDQAEPEFDKLAMKVLDGPGAEPSSSSSGSEDTFGGDENEFDERYDEILAWVSTQKEVSASGLQRHFRLGYPRAARLIEIFEKEGAVGPANGSKPRQVLLSRL